MKRFILLVAATLAIACTGIAPAQLPRDALDAVAPVTAVIAAIKHDNATALSALYADDAIVVDEQAPFEWTGSGAGAQWFAASRDWSKWSPRIAHCRATLANVQVDDGSGTAYVVAAVTCSSADRKKPWQRHGTLTLTVRKTDGNWKIRTQVWARTFP
jgi:ketosteroid isomerase-like protein